jgi:hypothetical protein
MHYRSTLLNFTARHQAMATLQKMTFGRALDYMSADWGCRQIGWSVRFTLVSAVTGLPSAVTIMGHSAVPRGDLSAVQIMPFR